MKGATHGIKRRKYHKEPPAEYSKDGSDAGPHCRCGLRLFGNEEIPGQCNGCLPLSATAFLGRRDEPVACSSGLRGSNAG